MQRQIVRINAQLGWAVTRDPRSERWIGVCDPLAMTAEAETFPELMETIAEILQSAFRELLSTGDLMTYLRDRGWTLMTPIRQAADERDLYAMKGLHFEKLSGNRKGQRSLKCNDQYRLIVRLEGKGQTKKVVLVEITDHYRPRGG